jgi:hypothetical protein
MPVRRFANSAIISHDDMSWHAPDHGLEFLLAFNGRIPHLEKGYWLKFDITRVETTPERPHGLSYSFTLEDFFDEVERVLRERGLSPRVIGEESERSK